MTATGELLKPVTETVTVIIDGQQIETTTGIIERGGSRPCCPPQPSSCNGASINCSST
jgi:hypothetical protein